MGKKKRPARGKQPSGTPITCESVAALRYLRYRITAVAHDLENQRVAVLAEGAETVACPRCEASAGQACENLTDRKKGVVTFTKYPHEARIEKCGFFLEGASNRYAQEALALSERKTRVYADTDTVEARVKNAVEAREKVSKNGDLVPVYSWGTPPDLRHLLNTYPALEKSEKEPKKPSPARERDWSIPVLVGTLRDLHDRIHAYRNEIAEENRALLTQAALTVACPTCGAHVEERCENLTDRRRGILTFVKNAHQERVEECGVKEPGSRHAYAERVALTLENYVTAGRHMRQVKARIDALVTQSRFGPPATGDVLPDDMETLTVLYPPTTTKGNTR